MLRSRGKEKTERVKVTKDSWKNALGIFKYVRPYMGFFVIGLIFLVLSSVTVMLFPVLMGRIFGTSSFPLEDWFPFLPVSDTNGLLISCFIIFAAQAVFSFCRIYFFGVVTENALRDLRQYAFARLIRMPMDFFNKEKVGELNSRVSADVALLQETFNTTLAEFFRQFITIGVGMTLMLMLSWELALWMLATIPVMALVAVFFGRFIKKLSKKTQEHVAFSNNILLEALTNIVNVKAYTNERFEETRYVEETDQVKSVALKNAVWRGVFVSFLIFSMFSSITLVLWKGTQLLATGDLAVFIMLAIMIGASFGSFPDLYAKVLKTVGATETLLDLIGNRVEEQEAEKSAEPLSGRIQFQEVSFTYASRPDMPVLKQVSFDVNSGDTVALVGASGAGKSTVASLLMQFYEPTGGKILYDGSSRNELGLSHIREHIAYVPQEVLLFGGTIEENIAYGNPDASDDEVRDAAKKAFALDFIQSFPEGMKTLVGDRGIRLSGGQKQRIAIARAFLKNPRILLLDEATSALDSTSEEMVQQALEELMKGRTTVVIAHRLSTIKNADSILVFQSGEIVEQGTHQALLTQNGIYASLQKGQVMETGQAVV